MNIEDLKKIKYSSWQNGNEWSEEELDFIMKHDCNCDYCQESVDEFNDFPELLIEENELLCEDCYTEKYRKICHICKKITEADSFCRSCDELVCEDCRVGYSAHNQVDYNLCNNCK